MKRAFTLIELLVVIAIIAILAAILFPVFAQAKEAAKKTADVSNVKQLATATAIYLSDSDDLYPLQAGQDATGLWGYNFMKFVPFDWAASGGGQPNRGMYSECFYMNTIQPYAKNYQMEVAPGAPDKTNVHSAQTGVLATGKKKETTTYAYNGFLTSYNATAVANVAELPLLTGNNGYAGGVGIGFANPALTCTTAGQPCTYVPAGTTCSTSNGGTGFMYLAFGSPAPPAYGTTYWFYSRGQNWALTDTHAKFRRVGATVGPADTDYRRDPFTNYNTTGASYTYWWNGCHAWLFRPDFDFVQ